MRELLADGASNGEIALRLSITKATVRTHLQSIMTKLGARNRSHAAVLWKERQT